MDIINISSVQQYTLDRLRVSLSNIIDFSQLSRLSYHIYDEENEILVFQSILESNPSYTMQTKNIQMFDLVIGKNSTLDEGSYRFELYLDEKEIYNSSFKTNYLEDIRVSFDAIEVKSLDTLHIKMKPLTPDTLYQTKKMMSKMSFSIIESNNTHFSSHFQSLETIINSIEEDYITEFDISLKNKETLPQGVYTIRLTTPYKSRTFPIIESTQTVLPYLTTIPPEIGNTMITTRSNGSGTFLSVIFTGGYMERTMLNTSEFKIYTNAGKDITKYFDPTSLSVTYYTSSDVDYITRLDVKMYTEYYQLEQGSYTIAFEWAEPYYETIQYKFTVGWVVPGIDKIYLYDNDLKHIVMDLTDAETEEWLENENYLVELDGKSLSQNPDDPLFGELEFTKKISGEKPDIDIHDLVSIPILKKDEIIEGNYTFILYHIDENNERVYDYIGNIDIISEVTPKITDAYQFGIQTLKIELEKRIPIDILNQCIVHVVDQFGAHTDYSNCFSSIEDSNIWEPGQTTSNFFDVYVNDTATITSGSFHIYLEFRGRNLESHALNLDYMEKAKGIIDSIIQTGIDTVEITFTQPQSRRFLMSVDLVVKDIPTGQSYTARFENWKNVLVDSNPSFTTLILPMDKGDAIPKGKYEFSFVSYTNKEKTEFQTIYKYQVDLNHMTRNIPEIGSIVVTKAENGLTEFQVNFKEYLEKQLFENAIITIISNNGFDLSDDLKEKEEWITTTVSKDKLSFYRTINIQVRDKDVKIERDTYTIKFSWNGIIPYMNDISKTAFSEYVLPKLIKTRVTSVNAEENRGRIYLEFPLVLQESFFTDAKVEVLTANGEDHTELFGTIQNSNTFNGPTNAINLNITELRDITFGVYQIIIYHIIDYGGTKVRESDYIGILNINAAVYPIITGVEQVAINKIEVKLQNPIPKNILEEYYFIFQDCKNQKRQSDFESINDSNQDYWEEDLEEVDSFLLTIKPGYSIINGLNLFEMWSGDPDNPQANAMQLDFYYFESEHLEGVNGEISAITPTTLSEVDIRLSSLESRLLFATMSLSVVSIDGEDFSDRFEDLNSAMKRVNTDYFEDFALNITSSIPAGTYTFGFYRKFPERDIEIPLAYTITLPYLSSTYPLVHEVTAGKVGNRMDGEDAIIIMFQAPGIERKQFEASNFIFRTVGQTLNVANDKFPDIHAMALDYVEDDEGTQFIEHITIPLKGDATIQKGDYEVVFNWSDAGTHNYMKEITREVSLDYILLPVEKVEQVDLDTLKVTFLEQLEGSILKSGKLDVTTIYEYQTTDGTKIIDVSFTSQFKKIGATNTFVDNTTYNTALLVVGPNEDYPGESQDMLPGRSYRVIISTEQKTTWGGGLELQFAFSGTIQVDFLLSTEVLNCNTSVDRTDYNALQYTFTKDQLISFLNNSLFFMREASSRRDYSSMFMAVLDANTYTRLGNDGKYITESYIHRKEKDNIIDKVHFPILSTPDALAKLSEGMMIAKGTYEIGFSYKGKEYFKTTKELPFMSGSHPEFLDMSIKDKTTLNIRFKNYPDIDSVLGSQFDISTYRGIREDGTVIGKSCRSSFGNIIGSELIKNEVEEGIILVSEINIPISPNVTIASGNYILKWTWPPNSMYHESTMIHGLNAVAGGIEYVRTLEHDTIEIKFDDELAATYMFNLDLSVINEEGEDCSILFKSFKDGNIGMGLVDTSITNIYYIQVDDDEIVPPNIYTFTLTENFEDEGEDNIDDDDIATVAYKFSMSITYLAYQFPEVTRVGNLSTEKFIITQITNDNAKDLFGYQVRLLNSTTVEDKEILSKDTLEEYLGQYVKIYQKPNINELTFELGDEVEDCLINALTVKAVTAEGEDVSDYFISPSQNTTFFSRDVIDYITLVFTQYYTGEELSQFDVEITQPNGNVITTSFDTIDDSNNLDDDQSYQQVRLYTDGYVETTELIGASYEIFDAEDNPIALLSTPLATLKTVSTTNKIMLPLNDDTTIIPGNYDIRLTYQNEIDIEDAVVITPFKYTGVLPFLSTNIGTINIIEVNGLFYLEVEFSENLPVELFEIIGLRILNEDGEDFSSQFEAIPDSNNFDDVESIENLENPYRIRLMLLPGESINAGNYTVEFYLDIGTGNGEEDSDDDDDPEESDEDDVIDDEEDNSDTYTLWSYSITLPFMVHEIQNSIKSVEVVAVNKLKVTLESPVDISLIQKYSFSLLDTSPAELGSEDTEYQDIFKPVKSSNFFGMYVLPTDQRYILYSFNGIDWNQFDTDRDYTIKKVFYDIESTYHFALCGNGKVLKIRDFTSNAENNISVVDIGTSKALNDYLIFDNELFIVGADATIIKGNIVNGEIINLTTIKTDATTKTLTCISHIKDNILMCCGYDGAIIMSTNKGVTWKKVETGFHQNINKIMYYENIIDITEEPDDPEDDEDGTTVGDADPEPVVIETINNSCIILAGAKGLLAYSKEISVPNFTIVETNTTKSFFDICGHDDTVIAVGDGGTIGKLSSEEDGLVYGAIESGVKNALRGVTYTDNKFMICGSNGNWLTSVSGSAWTVNSYYQDLTFRSLTFIPSQYGGTKGDWFYVELDDEQELGRIEIHKGTEEVTAVQEFNEWSASDREQHAFDIYRRYETINGETRLISTHQYIKETKVEGEGEDAVLTTSFSWKLCANMSNIMTGSYFGKIYITHDDDSEQLLYTTKKSIDLPYMVSNPGTITGAGLVSPDGIDDSSTVYPFLEITMENANEFILFYSSYSLIGNGVVNPPQDLFSSIYEAEIIYDGGYEVSGVRLKQKKYFPYIISTGADCKVVWDWMALAKEKTSVEIPFRLTSMKNIIAGVSLSNSDPGRIVFNLNKSIPISYFSDTKTTLYLYKLPTSKDDSMFETEFGYYFKSIITSTNFTSYPQTDGGYKNFDLEIEEGNVLPPGDYVVKLYNETINFDTTNEMNYFTKKISFAREVIPLNNLPLIGSVKSELYAEVVPTLTDHTPENHSGYGDPTVASEMVTVTSNWTLGGEAVLQEHVGDVYTDNDSLTRWYFIQDKINKTYRWEKSIERPYVSVSFSPMPAYQTFMANYSGITLTESNGSNLAAFLNRNKDYWKYETTISNGVKYITKVYIPIDETQNFPGSTNATISITFTPCIYKTLTYREIRLNPYIHSYGGIRNIAKVNVSLRNTEQIAGLYVEFERPQTVDFLNRCTFDLYRKYKVSGVSKSDDWSGSFLSISASNSEDFAQGLPMNAIWLFLSTNTSYTEELHSGNYEFILTGERPPSDLGSDGDDSEIVMKKLFNSPWLTTKHPKEISVSLNVKDTTKPPVLKINFKGYLPARSSCNKFKLKVEKIVKNKLQDYSNCFVSSSKATYVLDDEVFEPEEEKVKSISIKMKNARCLPKGSYKVTFHFSSYSLLDPIPYTDNPKKFATFGTTATIITSIGSVKKVTVKKRKMTVEIKPVNSLKTDKLLRASQVGKTMKVKNWKALLKKLGLVMAKGSIKNAKSNFKTKPKTSGKKATYELKADKKIQPGRWKFSYNYKKRRVIKAKTFDFPGIIYNKTGKGGKDKSCWILKEKHDGTTKCKIYKAYSGVQKRIKKMKKLNAAQQAQYEKCKKCRKKKFFSTTKIRAQLEKYEFLDNSLIRSFIKSLANKYYKTIVKKITKCTQCKIIKYTPDSGTSDKHVQYHCDNYIAKTKPYTWKVQIATMATKFPSDRAKAKSRKIYFKTFTIKGVTLPRGFKASKKGAKTKNFKSYEKKMKKWIASYKKKVAQCKKCRKYEIARKGGTSIGWGAALFPDAIRTNKKIKKYASTLLKKKLQQFFKKKRKKKVTVVKVNKKGKRIKKKKTKKYYIGCKNAKFSFVKKNKSYCKIKCAKQKATDNTLKLGEIKGIYTPVKKAKIIHIVEHKRQVQIVEHSRNKHVLVEKLIPTDPRRITQELSTRSMKDILINGMQTITILKGKNDA